MKISKVFYLIILVGLSFNAWSGDYEEALLDIKNEKYSSAIKKLQRAASAGDMRAEFRLGNSLKWGLHVKKNEKEGYRLIRMSAEKGYAEAQNRIGYYYFIGHPYVQDYSEAYRWYKLAALQGFQMAQKNLAGLYEQGIFVSVNSIKAHMWYNLSRTNFQDNLTTSDIIFDSSVKMRMIEKHLTSQELTKAQNMARECHETGFKKCE